MHGWGAELLTLGRQSNQPVVTVAAKFTQALESALTSAGLMKAGGHGPMIHFDYTRQLRCNNIQAGFDISAEVGYPLLQEIFEATAQEVLNSSALADPSNSTVAVVAQIPASYSFMDEAEALTQEPGLIGGVRAIPQAACPACRLRACKVSAGEGGPCSINCHTCAAIGPSRPIQRAWEGISMLNVLPSKELLASSADSKDLRSNQVDDLSAAIAKFNNGGLLYHFVIGATPQGASLSVCIDSGSPITVMNKRTAVQSFLSIHCGKMDWAGKAKPLVIWLFVGLLNIKFGSIVFELLCDCRHKHWRGCFDRV